MQTRRAWECLRATAIALFVVCFAGCGSTEPANVVHVSGTATYRGQPIPIGLIVFEPDPGKGNSGPQGHAEIKNGHFDTRTSQKGAVVGPLIVRIVGGDGVGAEAFTPFGNLLFDEYKTRIDLARDSTSLEFAVPERQSKR